MDGGAVVVILGFGEVGCFAVVGDWYVTFEGVRGWGYHGCCGLGVVD